MAQQIKLGSTAAIRFALYEADGSTKRAGAAGDVSTILTRDDAAAEAAEVVGVAEVAGLPGEYLATFTPSDAGTYTLVARDDAFGRDYAETVQVTRGSIDDVVLTLGSAFAGAPS